MRPTRSFCAHVRIRDLLLLAGATLTLTGGLLAVLTSSDTNSSAEDAAFRAASRGGPTALEPGLDRLVAEELAAAPARTAAAPSVAPREREADVYVGDDGQRITERRIRRYLEAQGSPLATHAGVIVEEGIEHDVDPRVVVAISAAESSFGTRQLGHNAWGWGASTVDNMIRWPDWPTAIREYTAALASKYDTDHLDETFAQRYVPPNWRWWLRTVTSVYAEM